MSSSMRDYSEKRDFIRMQVETEIELAYRSDPSRTFKGLCEDLSATGMSVIVAEAIPEGTELQTVLPSQNPEFPPFETYARVVRCDQMEDGRAVLGVEILEVQR